MNRIILFDGVCNFCDHSVQFIIRHDPKGLFYFAALQSEVGQELQKKYGVPNGIDSVVLIENEKAYYKSTAALKICRRLKGVWKLLYVFLIIPNSLRDITYDFIAKNRYKWFGKKESCIVPSQRIRKRFL